MVRRIACKSACGDLKLSENKEEYGEQRIALARWNLSTRETLALAIGSLFGFLSAYLGLQSTIIILAYLLGTGLFLGFTEED